MRDPRKRADISSFGVVLFEMLAARRLFTGETASEVLASVIKDEPDWTRLPSASPPTLRRLLRRCLKKNPRRRLHDIADARLELEDSGARDGGIADGPQVRRGTVVGPVAVCFHPSQKRSRERAPLEKRRASRS